MDLLQELMGLGPLIAQLLFENDPETLRMVQQLVDRANKEIDRRQIQGTTREEILAEGKKLWEDAAAKSDWLVKLGHEEEENNDTK